MAGLDLGEVQDIVYKRQQVFAGLPDDINIGFLFFSQVFFSQQLAETDNGIHRCTDLMTHAGEELAFGHIGHLSLGSHIIRPCVGFCQLIVKLLCLFSGPLGIGHHVHRRVPALFYFRYFLLELVFGMPKGRCLLLQSLI